MLIHRLILVAAITLVPLAGGFAAWAETINVQVTNVQFIPKNVTINPGDTVRWTNVLGSHNVDSDTPGLFRSGPVALPPWTYEFTFNNPGTFPYHCDIHGNVGGVGMSGTVTVQGASQTGTLRFSTATANVGEGGGNVSLTVQRINGDDGAASVQYATSSGSATAGADFQTTAGTVNWADNDDNNKTILIPIINDTADENNETFTVTLSNATGAALGTPSTVTVTILDNDEPQAQPGTLALSSDAISVAEGAGQALILVNRSGGSDGAASVNYATAAGSATAGQDFTSTNGTLNWTDGDSDSKSFAVPILNDNDDESLETFLVSLSNATGATLGTPSSATVSIQDDDGGVEPFTCVEDAETLCLAADRFQVRATFLTTGGDSGNAQAVELTADTGYLWFFSANNVEVVIKVLNACGFANRYWVFAGGLTNVEVEMTVTDSQTGTVKTYTNPQETAFQPIQDTDAFATCP